MKSIKYLIIVCYCASVLETLNAHIVSSLICIVWVSHILDVEDLTDRDATYE